MWIPTEMSKVDYKQKWTVIVSYTTQLNYKQIITLNELLNSRLHLQDM